MDKKIIEELSERFDSMAQSLESMFEEPHGIHGLGHTKRVYILACLIAEMENMNEQQKEVLTYAALYHDIGRSHNGICFVHGKAGFKKMIKNDLIDKGYTKLETLRFVIENHCIHDDEAFENIVQYKIVDKKEALYLLKAFKDADGLDRVRIGDLDERFLRLESSHKLVSLAYDLFKN